MLLKSIIEAIATTITIKAITKTVGKGSVSGSCAPVLMVDIGEVGVGEGALDTILKETGSELSLNGPTS